VPLLLLLPLLASARSWREASELACGAIAVLALTLGPLWASGIDLSHVVQYTGVPGWGGLSLVIDPTLGWHWLTMTGQPPESAHSDLSLTLQGNARWITAVALGAYTAFAFRYRPATIDAIALLWLVVYAFSPDFFLNYLVWGLPFFIMAGFLVEVGALQVLLIVPTLAYYIALWPERSILSGLLYVPALIALWAFWVIATLAVARRIANRRERQASGFQAPLVDLTRSGPWPSSRRGSAATS
jgi:hypothetical protein